jgi:hypothetical protein
LGAIESLKENNINISNLIIDDNWQDVDYNGPDSNLFGWKRFEAEPKAFPHGLKHTISQIRDQLPSIEHVAVWQYVIFNTFLPYLLPLALVVYHGTLLKLLFFILT